LAPRYGEKVHKMSRGEEGTYDELFSYACPKFITAALPNYDNPAVNTNQEAYRLQLRLFMSHLHQQRHLPTLNQLLKLYTVTACQHVHAWSLDR
jgi:translation initiation factor 3 subunit L